MEQTDYDSLVAILFETLADKPSWIKSCHPPSLSDIHTANRTQVQKRLAQDGERRPVGMRYRRCGRARKCLSERTIGGYS